MQGLTRQPGLTLYEIIVSLFIISILATAALPYVEIIVTRQKEIELRRALREIRGAIDLFHEDWRKGVISKLDDGVSEDGFPKTLMTMVEGVSGTSSRQARKKYLRRVPADPFASKDNSIVEHWNVRGYQDDYNSIIWNGTDVYDVTSKSEKVALNGTSYNEW